MKFEKKEICLKNGETCVLTAPRAKDAEKMLDYLKVTASETCFLLRYPDEVTFTLKCEREMLERFYEDEKVIMMSAFVNGELAGNCSVNPLGPMRRLTHRGSVAIALKKDYWGRGIATSMLEYLFALSKVAGYERLELGVIEGNAQAKHLYEKVGFVEIGRVPASMKYDDGTYRDEILMSKKL